MPHTEQKPKESPPGSKSGTPTDRGSSSGDAAQRKQHAAHGFRNHEDYPEGAADSDAPRKPDNGAAEDGTPNRRRRDPKP